LLTRNKSSSEWNVKSGEEQISNDGFTLPGEDSYHSKVYSGWGPTHLTSVFSLQTSVTSPHDTTLTAFAGVKYRCLRMLDGLVSIHP
jgi:hypothetical protein